MRYKKKYRCLADLLDKVNYIYICGNGGSASTANHLANDLVKMCGLKAISLCANEAIVMAYANDNGYENIFKDQLKVFLMPGDMVITISGSGTSPNILKAINFVRKTEDVFLVKFPTMKKMRMDMQQIEDYHLQLVHQIVKELSE